MHIEEEPTEVMERKQMPGTKMLLMLLLTMWRLQSRLLLHQGEVEVEVEVERADEEELEGPEGDEDVQDLRQQAALLLQDNVLRCSEEEGEENLE